MWQQVWLYAAAPVRMQKKEVDPDPTSKFGKSKAGASYPHAASHAGRVGARALGSCMEGNDRPQGLVAPVARTAE
jgi:hypothetical protein